MVVPESGPTLLGRNWQKVIQLSWDRIHQLKAVNATPAVEDILQRYPDVFKDKLGELRNYTEVLKVDPNKTHLLQSTSCALCIARKGRQRAGQAGVLGIIKPIQYSEWAAPIVAILKTDQSIRLKDDSE